MRRSASPGRTALRGTDSEALSRGMRSGLQAGLRAYERTVGPGNGAFPRDSRSGVMPFLDSSTVAGAAPELYLSVSGRTGFPFHSLDRMSGEHLKSAAI